MLDTIAATFRERCPAVPYWSLRLVDDTSEFIRVRQGVLQPLEQHCSVGAFVTVQEHHGIGYAATSDLSPDGLQKAFAQARQWANAAAQHSLIREEFIDQFTYQSSYRTPVNTPWDAWTLDDKIACLQEANCALNSSERIVDWSASLGYQQTQSLVVNSVGGRIEQCFTYVFPALGAVANKAAQTQSRSGGGAGSGRQGGLEQLEKLGFPGAASQIAEQAVELLDAPECPTGVTDLILMPSQMVLQIHESIGHPLELDRILGDERNYAGTSFVNLDMFGEYQYGSSCLNVTFNPTFPDQLASYGYDDEGGRAQKEYVIKDGVLMRPLGAHVSQVRAGNINGVANARACSWNRPPIDRMANLNVEPGEADLNELIASIEHGVLMDTNRSWSIDDSRNKFQFGCERGQLIEHGRLTGVVRNPNYRGVSAKFWRSLDGVGNAKTFAVGGVTNCGKGEPNQSIYVGHASPACRFRAVEVFGGG